MTIMVVSPDGTSAGLPQTLIQRGFSVTTAPSAAQALERMDRESPELVVCAAERGTNVDALADAKVLLAERPSLPVVLVVIFAVVVVTEIVTATLRAKVI